MLMHSMDLSIHITVLLKGPDLMLESRQLGGLISAASGVYADHLLCSCIWYFTLGKWSVGKAPWTTGEVGFTKQHI
jgi:hypothetical protein